MSKRQGLALVIKWRLKETERMRKQKRGGRGERGGERTREKEKEKDTCRENQGREKPTSIKQK